MRDALRAACRIDANGAPGQVPAHIGLAYGAWAPIKEGGSDGKVPDTARAQWLGKLASREVARDYGQAFESWKASFASPRDQLFDLALASRLLVGHGSANATQVGLTVHHTWGVPMIPGSALKGLCAHYTAAMFGPDQHAPTPWTLPEEAGERARYQGVHWEKRTIRTGPGDVYRALFGAPDADDDEVWRKHGGNDWPAGAARGGVTFHDAFFDPESKDEHGKTITSPFVEDVLTVHQKSYYDAAGKRDQPWPNDYDDPNPVAFLTVHPKARFLVVLSGKAVETALAYYILGRALEEWGVGAKTSLGYGRGTLRKQQRAGE